MEVITFSGLLISETVEDIFEVLNIESLKIYTNIPQIISIRITRKDIFNEAFFFFDFDL
ncbi:MAG: hypothetical protein Q4C39_01480 [Clostridia bacterium]|nr:hypothetical protein [Clostridia bacterium]